MNETSLARSYAGSYMYKAWRYMELFSSMSAHRHSGQVMYYSALSLPISPRVVVVVSLLSISLSFDSWLHYP
ncbi:unnamed protein product [Allacma fusca]|uniref:Uncharacterized protein n=1 Tax=Allacma fusca TaxID=39272 RepID=A0A8J2NJC2_9HEXA|nr:unnamed protein product [Allacma fusca]